MNDHGVNEDSLVEVPNTTSAEEIDEIRKRNIAYEYLCHLEEAKMWLEAVLNEKLPPTTELEESLRHGVYLAKLGHFIAPEVVPLSKIYDLHLQHYNVAGLQFRHTDNINHWLKALVISGLPKTFHPETTDVYDKKGMPKVIYCLHALSTHLFKMGRAPLIQALYGKINFTDDEISNMKQALEDNGIPMPAFQKIGGLLSEDLTDDTTALHDVIVKINDALDQTDTQVLLQALENHVAKLHDVKPLYIKHYWNILRDAKISKVKAVLDYTGKLVYEEIKAGLQTLNLIAAVTKAVDIGDPQETWKALTHPKTPFSDLDYHYKAKYWQELAEARQLKLYKKCNCQILTYFDIQNCIDSVNEHYENSNLVIQALHLLNDAVKKRDFKAVENVLKNPILGLPDNVSSDDSSLFLSMLERPYTTLANVIRDYKAGKSIKSKRKRS